MVEVIAEAGANMLMVDLLVSLHGELDNPKLRKEKEIEHFCKAHKGNAGS